MLKRSKAERCCRSVIGWGQVLKRCDGGKVLGSTSNGVGTTGEVCRLLGFCHFKL